MSIREVIAMPTEIYNFLMEFLAPYVEGLFNKDEAEA